MLCESIIQINGEAEFDPLRIEIRDKLYHVKNPCLGFHNFTLLGETLRTPVLEYSFRFLGCDGKCQLATGVSGSALLRLESEF